MCRVASTAIFITGSIDALISRANPTKIEYSVTGLSVRESITYLLFLGQDGRPIDLHFQCLSKRF